MLALDPVALPHAPGPPSLVPTIGTEYKGEPLQSWLPNASRLIVQLVFTEHVQPPHCELRVWCCTEPTVKSLAGQAAPWKSPISLSTPSTGTHITVVQVGSSQSALPSPLLSRPSRQSSSG